MPSNVDISQLIRMRDKLKSISDNPEPVMEDMTKEITKALLNVVTKKTPVGQYPVSSGKVGGTLRRGWTGGVQRNANDSQINVQNSGNVYNVELENPVEYASYVNNGHRTRNGGFVQGQFFVEKAVAEVQQKAPRIVYAKMRRILGDDFR